MIRNPIQNAVSLCLKLLLAILVTSTGCKKSPPEAVIAPYLEAYNLVYGSDSLQRYDLFLPEGHDEHTGAILLIHGGGWVSGDKRDCDYYAMRFSTYGLAAISMNYRLANDSVHCPEMLADVDSMISCIAKNAVQWGIDSGRISLFGYSAGGHLALLYSYSMDKNRKIKSVISLAGPADVQDSILRNVPKMYHDIKQMAGDTIPGNWTLVNPVSFVSASNPPTMLIHGTNDSLVPVSQSVKLYEHQKALNNPVRLLLLENETHTFSSGAIATFIAETSNFLD
jgi:acetyl esterase/lipase